MTLEDESDREIQIRREVTTWLDANWDPALTVGEWWALLAQSGWGYPSWPSEFFGRGIGVEHISVVRDVFAEAEALGAPNVVGQRLGAPTIMAKGTMKQQRQWLPRLATGEEAWCQLFSEPNAGSDLAGLQTRATRTNDGWSISGQKVWSSFAHLSDRGLLLARTDSAAQKHKGITYFVIDMDQPGIEVRPLRQMNGEYEFNEVFFTDAQVGLDRVLGTENGGWEVALTTLAFERFPSVVPRSAMPGHRAGELSRPAGVVARELTSPDRENIIGRASPVVDEIARRANRTDEVSRDQRARLLVAEELFRVSGARIAETAHHSDPGVAGSVRKLARSDAARQGRDIGAGIQGLRSVLVDPEDSLTAGLQGLLLTTHSSSIAGGTDEVQHNIIGERILGLPREPRPDRQQPFDQYTKQRDPEGEET